MALHVEELPGSREAVVHPFPLERARARARASRRAQLRRRVACGVATILVALVFFLGGGVGHSSPSSVTGAPVAVTIQPGQTLWDVADRYAPEEVDPRAYIDAVEDLNDLEGPLLAGQRIRLPR